MPAVLLLVGVLLQSPQQEAKPVTDAEKKEFIELVKKLPHQGEFFTDEGVKKAGPYLRVLLALTEKDLEKHDIYPFAALSRGLCNEKEHRDSAVKQFGTIAHPEIKLFWGVVLFDEKAASPEVVKHLHAALESKEQSKTLAELVGPKFEDFKKRVQASDVKEKK